jgi:hypothetical protein
MTATSALRKLTLPCGVLRVGQFLKEQEEMNKEGMRSARVEQAATEPLGGQPAPGAVQSVPDLEAQVAYQRAFEAVLWAMPASAIYRFRIGMLEPPGMDDNVITAFSGPLTLDHELITPNQVTPYVGAVSDLRKGSHRVGSSSQVRQSCLIWPDCRCLAGYDRRRRAHRRGQRRRRQILAPPTRL